MIKYGFEHKFDDLKCSEVGFFSIFLEFLDVIITNLDRKLSIECNVIVL